ncbi:hypothetical protein CCY99_07285 [Helicobacter sp. 16-1353]|uniref:hypothetical protein n=1 Tax=Helicobacter sp. 16-1353 TaxID=2004996 RepID=UPI000DCE668E|nr:hypothetical protein [Helicobacter sp. 16-1353]RAX52445.1 hypothetical protein CCY99_07285 [Helicobacter sp. 16-1353]
MSGIMIDGIYNKSLYFPSELQEMTNKILSYDKKIICTKHALDMQNREQTIKRIGAINIQEFITLDSLRSGEVVECYISKGELTKFVIRIAYDDKYSICAVVVPSINCNLIVTFYLNDFDDTHRTLGVEKYISLAQISSKSP